MILLLIIDVNNLNKLKKVNRFLISRLCKISMINSSNYANQLLYEVSELRGLCVGVLCSGNVDGPEMQGNGQQNISHLGL